MKNTFSIIIPAYNAEKFITDTLDAVRNQTYKEYEVIVINDGSKDNTGQVIQKYLDKYPDFRLKYFLQENGGAASARANGIEKAQNNYIAFLDADDIWYDRKLERVNDVLNSVKADVIYHDEYEITLKGKKIYRTSRQIEGNALEDLVINGNALSTSTVVVEHDVLNRSNTFKQCSRYGEDIQCWIELARNGATFYHIPEALGEYRRTVGSLTLGSPDYVRVTNEMCVEFYDLLDYTRYSRTEIEKLKEKRKIMNLYIQGRSYHIRGCYEEAKKEYLESLKKGGYRLKTIAMLLLAYVHIRY